VELPAIIDPQSIGLACVILCHHPTIPMEKRKGHNKRSVPIHSMIGTLPEKKTGTEILQ